MTNCPTRHQRSTLAQKNRMPDSSTILHRSQIAFGGFALALNAGYINTAMLSYFHVPVSHMTGATSRLGMDLVQGRSSDLWLVGSILLAFLFGAFLSGLVIDSRKLQPSNRYGTALIIEGLLLLCCAETTSMSGVQHMGVVFASMACGMQNAMASSYYGLVLRTTHVTGIVTDLGILLSRWAKRQRPEPWKIWILVVLFMGFLCGCVLQGLATEFLGSWSMRLPATVFIAVGVIYYLGHRKETYGEPASP